MFRKDPVAIKEWSEENVMMCAKRQRTILADIWPALAPGGYLAYSTCTFNIYENDLNLKWLREELGALHVDLSGLPVNLSTIPADLFTQSGSPAVNPGIINGKEGGVRFFPGLVRGEGFFFALFRKPSGQHSGQQPGQHFGQPFEKWSEKLPNKPYGQISDQTFSQTSGKQSYKQTAKQTGKQSNNHLHKKGDANPQIVPEDAFSILLTNDFQLLNYPKRML